jgi:glycosyltransferase involved in cell wall biosynthesis
MSVCVGIHVHAEPERLRASVAAVRERSPEVDVLLLADGADAATAAEVRRCGLPSSATAAARGAPACLNRLARESDADVVVLLESGVLVGPGWLERLVAALEADPGHGLAGPSTNRAWNEQGAFPGAREDQVEASASQAAERFGTQTRTLEPLLSLGDFCYAVRREVLDAIGGADETYGLGPCWEMDYNARAARAGFRGLWVCGAFVWRAPFTARRRAAEGRLFEASRRLYQDRLCALRLRSARSDYEPHCRGEACEHFAPRQLIELRRPLTPQAPREPATPRAPTALVSCIMPTRDRPDFVLQSVRYFQRQDHPERELVIVDDGDARLERELPDDPRIRYVRAPPGESIGAKRNRACQAARGALIAHWDDDDWFGPRRLSTQVAPIVSGQADMTGLVCSAVLDLAPWRFWTLTAELHERLFVGNVHGGTLIYRRELWERTARYPNRSLAEDAWLLWHATRRGARLARLPGDGHFLYLRHGENSWRFATGSYLDAGGWQPIAEPPLPPADRAFYAQRSRAATPPPVAQPLVTAIMPTADRRGFVPKAIEYFLRQDYANRELLVLDDGTDRVADLVPSDPRIRYVALDRPLILGAKRNRACELAAGEVIVHWDDDDWHAPKRISYQVAELERSGADLCGPDRVLYVDASGERCWLYRYPQREMTWVAGNGLCYRRALWQRAPFPAIAAGEDTRFVLGRSAKQTAVHDEHGFLVGLVHAANTSPKQTSGSWWTPQDPAVVRDLLGADFAYHLGR